MSEINPTSQPISGSDLSEQIAALRQDIGGLNEKIEVQGAIQIEIAKLLQSFHTQHLALPGQIAGIIQSALEASAQDKVTLSNEALSKLDYRFNQIAANFHTLKQVSNLTLRELRPPIDRIRCVFIVQSIPMWDALADVYWSMVDDARFHPIVVSINNSQLGRAEFTGEEEVHKGLTEQNIPHLRMNVSSLEALDILRSLNPDVVFRQQQWDSPVPPGLRTPEITFARICVVPYGMGLLAKPNSTDTSDEAYDNNYDQAYHRMAWRVFCETEITRTYYRSFAHSDPDKFVLSGYSKLDKLLEAKGKGVWPIPEPNGRSFRIIWAPHHSLAIHGEGFGVFHKIYRQMLEWAQQATDIQFVYKPHPALSYSAPRSGAINDPDYPSFLQTWEALPNCAICEGSYGELFDASDMMLTDGVSFLTEYHLFAKPIVFIDSGVHARFNHLGRLAEAAAHRVDSFEEMRTAALSYKDGKAWPLEKERQDLLEVLRPRQEPASRIILDSIADGIHSSRS
ncbi:CDP-glycerol glycerophosphotransferase family protein [Allorhizobium pseudoryzae]|uniref:CDP-glycerol glycerophosphotransferase family protein n=1 Tax=Allorhizobium pseudoryzae TaxID=379684 RepID=UPI0013EBF0D3|nr:CDP-glycerol glycerophosphotransferase family protein [Allorhizobium pseudoryzae]